MNLIKKSFTVLSVIAVTVWSVGLASFVPTAQAASSGDLIKGSISEVYYLGFDGKRYVFPNEATYNSWYADFSSVITLTDFEISNIDLGTNVTMRPGVKMVKITSNPDVYAVGANGTLHKIPSEAVASDLYGANWNKMIVDVPTSFWSNYTVGSAITTASDFSIAATTAAATSINVDKGVGTDPIVNPVGGDVTVSLASDTPASSTLVAGQATADLAHFKFTNNSSTENKITKLTLTKTGISSDSTLVRVFLFNGAVKLTDSASVSLGKVSFADPAGVIVVPANSSVTISVKADVASGTAGQSVGISIEASADVTSNGGVQGSFPIVGNGMSIAGVTDLATADFNGTTTLPATASVDPGNDVVVFQRSLTTTQRNVELKSLTLREIGSINSGDITNLRLFVGGEQVATGTSFDVNGYTTFVLATPYTLTTGAKTLKVLADVVGGSSRTYSFSMRNAADIQLTDSSYNVNILSTTNSTDAFSTAHVTTGTQTVNAGSVTSQKASDSKSGNVLINATDVSLGKFSLKTYGEDVKIDTLTAGFVYTDTVSAVKASGTITVIGDDTTAADTYTTTVGTETASLVSWTTSNNNTATLLADAIKLLTGYEATATLNVVTVTATSAGTAGNVAITTVTVDGGGTVPTAVDTDLTGGNDNVTNSAATLRNGRILVDGVQAGSTTTLVAAGTTFTTNKTILAGQESVIEVRADIYDNDGTGSIEATDTIQASLDAGSNNAQGKTSGTVLSTPTASVNANPLTVASGSLSGAKNATYPNQNVVVPQSSAYKIGAFNLTGDSVEDINIDTLTVALAVTDNAGNGLTASEADITNLYVKYGSKTTNLKSTGSTSNVWSLSESLVKNGSMVIEVYGLLGSDFGATDTIISTLTVAGTTAATNQAVTTGAVTGQTITAANATVSAAVSSGTSAAKAVTSGLTSDILTYKITSVNDAITLTDLTVNFPDASAATVITNVKLKEGATVIQERTLDGSRNALFTGLSIPVMLNSSKELTIAITVGNIGTGSGTSGSIVTAQVTGYNYTNSQGTLTNVNSLTDSGNVVRAYKSTPTVAAIALPTTVIGAGLNTIAKVSVTAPTAGPIAVKQLIITANTSGATVVAEGTTPGQVKVDGIVVPVSITNAGIAAGASGTITVSFTTEVQINESSSRIFEVAVGGTSPATHNSIAAYIATDANGTYDATDSFVWSDLSSTSHTTPNTGADWADGYLVAGLPSTTQTVSN